MTWHINKKSPFKVFHISYFSLAVPFSFPLLNLSLYPSSHNLNRLLSLSLSTIKDLAMKGAKSSTRGGNDAKLSVKKSAAKNGKDPNKPKRPPSAFFVFMEDFRKQYKEEHPKNKSVAVVGKAGGEKWKSLSDAEKAPFIEKAEKRKKEYEKTIQAYNKKQAEGAGDDDSDKSKSEVNDEDGSGEEEDDDDDE